jgi:hypothetical protein
MVELRSLGLMMMRFLRRRPEPPEPDPDFLGLLAEGGLASFERQLGFAELVGERDSLLDQESGVLRLGDDLVLPVQLLGSEATGSGTWL